MIKITTILLGGAASFGALFIIYLIKDVRDTQLDKIRRGYEYGMWEIFKERYSLEFVVPIIIASITSVIGYILIYILEGII